MSYMIAEFLDADVTQLYGELNEKRELVCMREGNGDIVPDGAWPWHSWRCIGEIEKGPWEP